MTWLRLNYQKFLSIYWQDVDYYNNQKNNSLLDFEVDEHGWGEKDNMTVDFTLTFEQPYMIGLLVKISDRLFIDVTNQTGYNYSGLLFGNLSEV